MKPRKDRHVSFSLCHGVPAAALTLLAGCATFGESAKDDENPEVVSRTGPRALVMVADNAFSYGSGGSSVTVSGPEGTQTYSWTVNTSGWGWSQGKAQQLEEYFVQALQDSGAFYVSDRATVMEARADRALEAEGLQEERGTNELLKRPDLKLVCTLTKLEDDAGGSRDSATAGGFSSALPGFLRGSGSRATQRGECEILVKIIDRASGLVVATAKGAGFSVGKSQGASANTWTRLAFGGASSSDYEGVDMAAAIQRATVRAVNDLVQKIPQDYYRHQLTIGGGGGD